MQYKPVSWSAGEAFSSEKVKQMAENDEVIQNLYLQTALGTISEGVYFDKIASADIIATPGTWQDIIILENVFLYPSRWIKINAVVHGAVANDRGTYIPFRVLMDGSEMLYMRTPDAELLSFQLYASCSGARIMASVPGTHEFKLQIGNDYASAIDDTSIRPVGAQNPTILSIDDIGGTSV